MRVGAGVTGTTVGAVGVTVGVTAGVTTGEDVVVGGDDVLGDALDGVVREPLDGADMLAKSVGESRLIVAR